MRSRIAPARPIHGHDSSVAVPGADHGLARPLDLAAVRSDLSRLLGLAGYTGGPVILAGGIGLAVAGWKMAR